MVTFNIIEYKPQEDELTLSDGQEYPSFDFWEQLRQNKHIPFQTRERSSIAQIPARHTPFVTTQQELG